MHRRDTRAHHRESVRWTSRTCHGPPGRRRVAMSAVPMDSSNQLPSYCSPWVMRPRGSAPSDSVRQEIDVSISDGNTMVEFDQSNALDGSAAAGAFSVALGVDASMIDIVCAECGYQAPFAEERAYVEGPGTTLCSKRSANVCAPVAPSPASSELSRVGKEC